MCLAPLPNHINGIKDSDFSKKSGSFFPAVNSYYIRFIDRRVNVDIRFVGDGYYDAIWEQVMLENRVLFNDCIYVLDPVNYFYSLAYHALFQKAYVSNDYQEKLLFMAKELKIRHVETGKTEQEVIQKMGSTNIARSLLTELCIS